ncbi:MBL fold metallo-hydrolase [Curtobacterium sp. RRHDQ10]|uniref:MBL fold metallo-hydrolase n=1 Tax=Curtobacterium phyllosphaerae TaxID=3413379 RepID=UPI003BF442A1
MDLTKYTHATVVLTDGDRSLVIDPGAYTPNSADLVAGTTAVLVTHAHPDHFDAGVLAAALDTQPGLRVWAPASVTDELGAHDGRVTTVSPGDTFQASGFAVEVVGGQHAVIHPDIPVIVNVGYVVDGNVYHPGDAYLVPSTAVETLLVPTSGPWSGLAALVDFIRAVAPTRAVQIHDLMLSDAGRASSARFAEQLTGIELVTLADGETIAV